MAESKSIKPLPADYMPQAGDVLGNGLGARAVVSSIEDGVVRYTVHHGTEFVESCSLPIETFVEMARNQAIALARAKEVGCG